MSDTDNQSCIIRPESSALKAHIQVERPQNAIKIIHLRSLLSMPGSGVAMATCLRRRSCLQSCFSIQQRSVASRFKVAPPCRELITWRNEQALAAPEKCLGEQRLPGGEAGCRGNQPIQNVFVRVGKPRLGRYCILCSAAENCWKKTEILDRCFAQQSSHPACYLCSSKKLKFLRIRLFCNFYMYRRGQNDVSLHVGVGRDRCIPPEASIHKTSLHQGATHTLGDWHWPNDLLLTGDTTGYAGRASCIFNIVKCSHRSHMQLDTPLTLGPWFRRRKFTSQFTKNKWAAQTFENIPPLPHQSDSFIPH